MRWKTVIPLLIILFLIAIFVRLFLNNIVEGAIISAGESIFGAKVEIGELTVKGLSIDIRNLKIADRNDPWRNLIDVGRIGFGVEFLPLLSKKIVIKEVSVTDLCFGTKRTTSGALPPRKIKKIEKKNTVRGKGTTTAKFLGKIKEIYQKEISKLGIVSIVKDVNRVKEQIKEMDLNKVISEVGLESIDELSKLTTTYNRLYEKYTTELADLDLTDRITLAKKCISEAETLKIESIADIPKAREKIDKLNQCYHQLQETANKITSLRNSIVTDFADQKVLIKHINDLVNNDYKKIVTKLKIEPITGKDITRAIIGPVWLSYVKRIIGIYHTVHSYLPRKKDKKKAVYPRMKGVDVIFYREEVLPRFLIKQVNLSGKTPDSLVDIHGNIIDINSDPQMYKKPTLLTLDGRKGSTRLQIDGNFDHTTHPAVNRIIINLSNYPITNIGKIDYLPQIDSANVTATASFTLQGNELSCEADIILSDIKISTEEPKDDLERILFAVITGLKRITLSCKLYGPLDNLVTEISSNIDEGISARLKAIYTDEIAKLNKRVRETLEKNILPQKETFLKQCTNQREQLIRIYAEKQEELQGYVKNVNDVIENLKKRITEQEKKKLEKELQEKIAPQIDKIFRR